MSNCTFVKNRINEFIDDELSIDETNRILEHIAKCKKCEEEIEKEKKLRNLIRKNFEKTPPSFLFKLDKKIFECFEAGNKLVEFADGTLTQEERKKISAHLLECAHCRKEYDKIKEFNSKVKSSLASAPFKSQLNIKKLVIGAICENKKHIIVTSSAIASCVMVASLVSFSTLENPTLTEVSFKKDEVVQEKPEEIVLKDIEETTFEDSQKLIHEIK